MVSLDGGDDQVVRVMDEGGRQLASGSVSVGARFVDLRTEMSQWMSTGTDERRAAALSLLVPRLIARVPAVDRPVRWWVVAPDQITDAVADSLGLPARRDLLQFRRPLPLDPGSRGDRPVLATRPIRLLPAEEDAVVGVNNRAFSWHPDQADRDRSWIVDQTSAPWFDRLGFLVHDGDGGGIDGFCWTKVHADHDPPLGEIYVIAVDPAAQGRGLGRALTVAGLDHLTGRDISVGMLYVEGSNDDAVAMYHRLGFVLHHIERAYQGGPV